MTKRYFQVKVTYKLLHNSRATDLHPPMELGTIKATATYSGMKRTIRLNSPNFDLESFRRAMLPDSAIGDLQNIIRERVRNYCCDGDSRYPISWSEDNCIETEIRELA